LTNRAAAISDAEFSGDIEKIFGVKGIEVHRKATDVMAVYQVSEPLNGARLLMGVLPQGAVKYDEFRYGWKQYTLYYEELNGETPER
jgi:hypothetical protein